MASAILVEGNFEPSIELYVTSFSNDFSFHQELKSSTLCFDEPTSLDLDGDISYSSIEDWGLKNGHAVLGLYLQEPCIGPIRFPLPASKWLYRNSKNGDFQIECADQKIVRADRIVLISDTFFSALNSFNKTNFGEGLALKKQKLCHDGSADLSQFSKDAVVHLVQFIYTGNTGIPQTSAGRIELLELGDYTNNETFCAHMVTAIKRIDFSHANIMNLLICVSNRPQRTIKTEVANYYCSNRDDIMKEKEYNDKLVKLFANDVDLDLLQSLLHH